MEKKASSAEVVAISRKLNLATRSTTSKRNNVEAKPEGFGAPAANRSIAHLTPSFHI